MSILHIVYRLASTFPSQPMVRTALCHDCEQSSEGEDEDDLVPEGYQLLGLDWDCILWENDLGVLCCLVWMILLGQDCDIHNERLFS